MKPLLKILTITLALGFAFPASAVTQKEMDKARALAAKAYLRFANDGSGYLDEISPSSLADLEKQLKAKEKENIQAFKSIPLPSGYESWGKEKLVEFWGNAFSTPGLLEKGKLGRSRAKKYIGEMTLTSTPESEDKGETAAPQPTPQPGAAPQAAAETSDDYLKEQQNQAGNEITPTDAETAVVEETPAAKVKDNSTTYIVILVILVAAVIALVVFASNVMKKNGGGSSRRKELDTESEERFSKKAEEIRAKYSASLATKNNEIAALTQKIEGLTSQNVLLRRNIESLTTEVSALKQRLAESAANLQKAAAVKAPTVEEAPAAEAIPQTVAIVPPTAAVSSPQPVAVPAPQQVVTPAAQQVVAPAPQVAASSQGGVRLRTIYLGKVNAKGIFIRADRNVSIGNTVYRLDTTDGYSGSYRVADDPTVVEMALLTPRETLSGGCNAPDIENTSGMSRIVTDTAGTAIFENGCWKVLRKAKIHFEE